MCTCHMCRENWREGGKANAGAGEASGIEAGAAISAQPVGSSMRQKPPKVARRSEEREPIFPVVHTFLQMPQMPQIPPSGCLRIEAS